MYIANDKPLYTLEWGSYDLNKGCDKMEYDIILKDGTLVVSCYPNAGYFLPLGKNPIRSKERTGAWKETEVNKIRITPFDKQQIGVNFDEVYQP